MASPTLSLPVQTFRTAAREGISGDPNETYPAASSHPHILVGIPALNEEIAIGSIILRSLKHADSVVVVDDCSADRTAEIAGLAGAGVISHKTNGGKGAGIRDIFACARDTGADILVLIDGDGQHDPGEIPVLLEPLLGGKADMVIGSRFLPGAQSCVPVYRRFGQEVLTVATNLATGVKVTDSQSGFRAFSRRAFDCFSFRGIGIEIESEMLIEAAGAGLKIVEVPVHVRYDVNGSTYHPLPHGFRVMKYVLRRLVSGSPVLFFGLPGAMFLLAGLVFLYMALDALSAAVAISAVYSLVFVLCTVLGLSGIAGALNRRGEKPQQNLPVTIENT